jgi:hypothetical protein
VSGGVVSGSFTVASGASGTYSVAVTGNTNDLGSAAFTVFTYSLSNSGGITVTQGSSGTNTITATLQTGTTQSVTLSCTSVLPTGTSCSFNPSSGSPTFSSTLTVSTSSSTPTGSYTITVNGSPPGITSTTFSLTVNPSAEVTMTVSYSVVGGGSLTAPVFHYVLKGASKSLMLTKTANVVSVDAASAWSVTPNPLGGSSSTQRWYSAQPLSGTASSTTMVFSFYHQTWQMLSYSVVGGGSGYSAPVFQANQFGVVTPVPLANTATGNWFDSGSDWTVLPNPLTGSTTSERWFTTQATSGTIGASSTRTFTYQHQFYLTMLTSSSSAGTIWPASGWHNTGGQVIILAIAQAGHKFVSWTGTGSGSYTGTSMFATITMNSAITETANFS